MSQAEDALQAILRKLQHNDPTRLKKVDLLGMREEVIRTAAWGLTLDEDQLGPIEYSDVDPDYFKAVRLVLQYKGRSRFMSSLFDNIHNYGGLTPNQVRAVLAPPNPQLVEKMRELGITGVEYTYQAYDAINAVNKELIRRAKEEE